jgi:hypothetical protein
MYVLSEEEYSRLKLMEKTSKPSEKVFTDDESIMSHHSSLLPPPPSAPLVLPSYYKCPICAKNYKQKRDLRRHVKTKHLIKPPTTTVIPTEAVTLVDKNTVVVNKKKKKKTIKQKEVKVFDKVTKWMTMRD